MKRKEKSKIRPLTREEQKFAEKNLLFSCCGIRSQREENQNQVLKTPF